MNCLAGDLASIAEPVCSFVTSWLWYRHFDQRGIVDLMGFLYFFVEHQDIISLPFCHCFFSPKSSYILCSNHQLFKYQVEHINTEHGLFQYGVHMSQPNCCSQDKEKTASTTRCCFHLWHFQLSNALSCRFHHFAQSAPVASASDVHPLSARDLGSLGSLESVHWVLTRLVRTGCP